MSIAVKFQDQMGNEITLEKRPKRIVSLVPSITELLCDLGLRDSVVGCTKFCVHPIGFKKKVTIVGGTKSVHIDRVRALSPDLIIANKEENNKETIHELRRYYQVWVSDIKTVDEAYSMITAIGEITETQEQANKIIVDQQTVLTAEATTGIRVAYMIWSKPWMTVGGDTYISDMLKKSGYINRFSDQVRYPTVEIDTLKTEDLDMIMLSTEPYPFGEKHIKELQERLPDVSFSLVDGEFFSWYGSRITHMTNYLAELRMQNAIKN